MTARTLKGISEDLCRKVADLRFSEPVTHVYNPLVYAAGPHRAYLRAYGAGSREVLLLGMNPGPWGMAQTGVPFGEINAVRDWLGITGRVKRPDPEHPKRPVQGFDCARSEVSGARLWGWAQATFGTPDRFFSRFFVANYCPLVFMAQTGKNITPDQLAPAQRAPLLEACDEALRQVVRVLGPSLVVGVGKFAEKRAQQALAALPAVKVGGILHPSPASPAANRGWAEQATAQLRALGALPRAR